MSNLQFFDFHGHEVRIVVKNGAPWFVYADVRGIVGIAYESVKNRLDDDEKDWHTIPTPGGPQKVRIISEPGLYTLLIRSRKAEAKPFRKWVTAEVLPTIRKTGQYDVSQSKMLAETTSVQDPLIKSQIETLVAYDELKRQQEKMEQDLAIQREQTRLLWEEQQSMTIDEYVYYYGLSRQMKRSDRQALGKHLTKYCMENDIPVYDKSRVGRSWEEHTYPVRVIKSLIGPWLKQRFGQINLVPYRRDA